MIQSIQHRAKEIVSLLEDGFQRKVFSGAQAAICSESNGEMTLAYAGTTTRDDGIPIDDNTLFDIASVTKVFTATCALLLFNQKQLDLDARLDTLLPELKKRSQGKATLAELLAHEARFQAWLPLF